MCSSLALERGIINYDEDGDIDDELSLYYYTDQALIWAVQHEHVDIIQMLIDIDVNINTNEDKALRTASYEGYYDVVKILLENGADVHSSNDDSIKWASTNGHHRIVKLLLDYHANPAIGLSGAIKYDHYNIVKLLKKYIMKTKYKKYNESLRSKIIGKSENELIKALDNLSDSEKVKRIITLGLSYDLLPDKRLIVGDLRSLPGNLTSLPDDLIINGNLYCENNQLISLPNNLKVNKNLFCGNNKLTSLLYDLIVNKDIWCKNNKITKNIRKPIGVKGQIFYL